MEKDWASDGRLVAHCLPAAVRGTGAKVSREQRVRDLISRWQPRLRLQAWDIRFVDEALPDTLDESTAMACITVAGLTEMAQMWIHPDAPDADLEAIVLHELGHLVMDRLNDLVDDMAPEGSPQRFLWTQFHAECEKIMDSYAEAITGRRPLFGSLVESQRLSAWGYVPKKSKAA